jgi:peptide deformylase
MKIDSKFLHQPVPDITFKRPSVNLQIANLLYKFMIEQQAIGLAANQVGRQDRVFVMCTQGQRRVCFNPEIVSTEQDLELDFEGCLSYPKQYIKVARPHTINVKYYNHHGIAVHETLTDISARCFQHELDHLNGITMHQRHKEQLNVSSKSRN